MDDLEIRGEVSEEPPSEKARAEKEVVARAYACETDAEPEWCVADNTSAEGEERVLHWIRPSIEAEFIALRIARLVTALGGSAMAKQTKWHQKAA